MAALIDAPTNSLLGSFSSKFLLAFIHTYCFMCSTAAAPDAIAVSAADYTSAATATSLLRPRPGPPAASAALSAIST